MSLTAPPMPQEPPTPMTPDPLPPEAEIPEFEIRQRSGWVAIDIKELIHYRELLYFLTWRDVKVRYKQTVLGFAWAILQPLMMVVIQTVIFGKVAGFADKIPQELRDRHIPYSLFNYAGVLAWTLFATGVSSGGTSLMNQQNLLTKIYFPRLFVPTSVRSAAMVDAVISLGMFFVLMGCDRVMPPSTILLIPFLLLLTALASMGFAF